MSSHGVVVPFPQPYSRVNEGVQAALERSAAAARQAEAQAAAVPAAKRRRARLKSAAALGVAAATLPVPLALSTWAAVRGLRKAPAALPRHGERRTALVMGVHMSKGLHLCRHLHAAGFHVIGADFPAYRLAAARLSSALDEFVTLPAWHPNPDLTLAAIATLVRDRSVALVVSSATPNQSIYDALVRAALPPQARGLAVPPELMAELDHKLRFTRLCEQHGLPVPKAVAVTSPDEIFPLNASGKPYVLKRIAYDALARAANLVLPMPEATLRARLRGLTITAEMPWMAQERLSGTEYSTYAIARHGRLIAYADTRAQLSNLRYQHLGDPRLETWVRKLCAATQLDGQVCIDFMEDGHGGVMAIECNPRASTVLTTFAQQPEFARALASPDDCPGCITPRPGTPLQFWLMHELFAELAAGHPEALMQLLLHGHDALLSSDDPWPFLGMHALQIPSLLARCLRRGLPWSKVDVNIGKLAQVGGD